MSSEETATSESTEASPPDESQQRELSPEGTDWRAENTRLRQQLKHAQDLNREAMPYVQDSLSIQADAELVEIVRKHRAGEKLTGGEKKELASQVKAGTTAGMSAEQVQQMLDTAAQSFEQRLWESRKAEKAMDQLHVWASEKYPGYSDIRETPEWNGKLGTVLDAIQNGTLQVPAEWSDSDKYALDQTYGWVKGLNPDIGKETPSKKSEKDRRSAISQSSVQAGGVAPEDSDKLPDWANPGVTPRGVTGGGRSFSSLKRTH